MGYATRKYCNIFKQLKSICFAAFNFYIKIQLLKKYNFIYTLHVIDTFEMNWIINIKVFKNT